MKRFLVAFLCLFAAACGTTAPGTTTTPTSTPTSVSADEAPAIKTAFETYVEAALSKDGATGVSLVASPIMGLYEEARKLALTGTEEQLSGLQFHKRFVVYLLRGEIDPATLRSASAKDIVKIALDKGLVAEQSISNLSLGEIEVNGETAQAEVLSSGKKAPWKFRFVREDGAWKIDLQPLLELAEPAMLDLAKQRNLTVDELLEQLLVAKYGPAKAAELRKPLGA
ncbi:hypothetical protein LFM09_09085 [Lentzea alba]|uniref:hypothetical protein n=1 Tax=Lentzea alba TaxID=2714351 RepID=UPI0039BF9DB7